MNERQERVTSGWAIASFSFAMVTLSAFVLIICMVDAPIVELGLLASPPLSVICGAIALLHISRSRSTVTGSEWAVIGTILGVIAMVVFIPPLFSRGHPPSKKRMCINNLKQIGTAINMYESDWDDRYPLVSGPGREFERVYGWTYNYRTKSFRGERRWFQNLVGSYAKNKKIFMCPAVGEDQKWRFTDPVSRRSGTVVYANNRHGGDFPDKDPKRVGAPDGSSTAGLKLENDPPTSYWFNVCVTKPGKPDKAISGRSEEICYKTADAPIVWDTPDGFDNGGGESNLAHEDVINVCYADGHAKPFQIPQTKAPEWLKGDFRLNYGSEGWFPEK